MVELTRVDIIKHNYFVCLWVPQVAAIANTLRIVTSTTHLPNDHLHQKVISQLNLTVEGTLREVNHFVGTVYPWKNLCNRSAGSTE
jgi:hypothetical protein